MNKIQVNGCLGCNACRYEKPCIQKDDFSQFIPKIKEADLIVFASPLYIWTISSKIKAFIERFFCIAKPDKHPPLGRYETYPIRDCALLMTSADNFFWTCWKFKRHGADHDVYTKGTERESVPRHKEIKENLAKSIIKRRGLK